MTMDLQTQIRLPAYVRTIDLQVPPEHQFSVHDLRWISIVEKWKHYKVAAVPLNRLEDLVCGEGTRAAAHVYCHDKGNNTAGILTSKIGVCFYGKLKGTCQKKEATKTLAEACAAVSAFYVRPKQPFGKSQSSHHAVTSIPAAARSRAHRPALLSLDTLLSGDL
jgi:hypothetical protein